MKNIYKMIFRIKDVFISNVVVYFLVFVILLSSIFYNYAIYTNRVNFEKSISGNTSFIVKENKHTTIDDLKKKGFINEIGVLRYIDSSDSKDFVPMNLFNYDEGFININNSKIIKGNPPKSDDEIVLEKWTLPMFGNPRIGDMISIPLYKKHTTKEYKIVGIVEDVNYNKIKGSVAAYILEPESAHDATNTLLFLGVDNRKNAIELTNYIKTNIKDRGMYKEETLAALYKEDSNKTILVYSVVESVILLMILIGVFTINRDKLYRLSSTLKILGISRKDHSLILFVSQVIYAVVGFVLAFITCRFVTLPALEKIYSGINLYGLIDRNFYLSILIVFLNPIIMYLISNYMLKKNHMDLSAKRNKEISRALTRRIKKGRLKRGRYRLEKTIEEKLVFLFIDSYKYKLVFMSVIIAICSSVFLTFAYNEMEINKQLKAIFSTSAFKNSFEITIPPTSNMNIGISGKDVDYFKDIKINKNNTLGDKISSYQEMYCKMFVNNNEIKDLKYIQEKSNSPYVKNVLKGVLKKGRNQSILKFTLFGVGENELKKFGITEKELGNKAILYMPKGKKILGYKAGDTIEFTYPKNYVLGESYFTTETSNADNVKVQIGKIVDFNIADTNYYVSNNFPNVIVSNNTFKKLTGVDTYRNVVINTNKEESLLLENTVNKVFSKYNNISIINKIKERDLFEQQAMLITKAGKYVSLIILFCILMNLCNLIISEYIQRKEIYNKLYVIGMSKKMIKATSLKESLIISVPIAVMLTVISLIIQVVYYNKYVVLFTQNPSFKIYWNYYAFVIVLIVSVSVLSRSIGLRYVFNTKR